MSEFWTRKKSAVIGILLAVLGTAALCGAAGLGILLGPRIIEVWHIWRTQQGEIPSAPPAGFLVSVSLFPDRWSLRTYDTAKLASESFRGEIDAALADFSATNHAPEDQSWAFHNVARFSSEQRAHENYLSLERNLLAQGEPWRALSGWEHEIANADEYRLVCTTEERRGFTWNRCAFIARYGKYLSDFVVTAHPEDISPEQVKNILKAIDQAFVQRHGP